MSSDELPALSVLVATRNRASSLQRALRSLDAAAQAADFAVELIVVDNGSTDETAALLDAWVRAPERVRLSAPGPGKSRALNHALSFARAPLLAFTDDDVEVEPQWYVRIVAFLTDHPEYAAAVGRVRMPPDITDPKVIARVTRYATVPLFDRGDAVRVVAELYGCNMVVRREVFATLGTFNERLGVGASGSCEDTDLAERIRSAGMRIGYMPDAVVYHAVELDRLTVDYFRAINRRVARSHFEMHPERPWWAAVPRFLDAAAAFAWWTLIRNPTRRMHAWGRMIRHGELLQLRWRHRASLR